VQKIINLDRVKFSVADPDPVGSGPFWSDPDTDLNKWLCINFFGVCKRHKYRTGTKGIYVVWLFGSWTYFLQHFSSKKIFWRKLAENLLGAGSGTGSGSGRFWKSDPDQVKNRPDSQHCWKCNKWLSCCGWGSCGSLLCGTMQAGRFSYFVFLIEKGKHANLLIMRRATVKSVNRRDRVLST
jgi:hypothetical protein